MNQSQKKMPDAWRKPNRRRSDMHDDLAQLRAAGWFWVAYFAVLAIVIWLALPEGVL